MRAIVGGAFLGDKASPVSDTANTVAAIAGVNLFRHITSLLYITVAAAVVSAAIYGIWDATHSGGATPEQVNHVPATTDAPYTFFNLLCPLLSILAGLTGFAIFRTATAGDRPAAR